MTLVAFAAGLAQTFEGFGALQLAETGIGSMAAGQKARAIAAGAKRIMCEHPPLLMAAVNLLSSQLSTHTRVANLWHAIREGAQAIGQRFAQAAKARRNLPHGLAMCGELLVLMAFINYGDAAFSNHFVRIKGAHETLAIYSSIMQSMPPGTAPLAQKPCGWAIQEQACIASLM
eukprot:789219-Pleurochrysis_carterae.AAC.1